MKFPIGKILGVATRVTMAIATGVPAVQVFAETLGHGTEGAQKKAAVVDLAKTELAFASSIVGRDLSHDGDVLEAIGAISDAVYAFHKLLANKVAPAATP